MCVTFCQRESLAEGMRSPAFPPNPDDSEDSDCIYFSESDEEAGGNEESTVPVPEWSELETAVQALMTMENGVDPREDLWDSSESARCGCLIFFGGGNLCCL